MGSDICSGGRASSPSCTALRGNSLFCNIRRWIVALQEVPFEGRQSLLFRILPCYNLHIPFLCGIFEGGAVGIRRGYDTGYGTVAQYPLYDNRLRLYVARIQTQKSLLIIMDFIFYTRRTLAMRGGYNFLGIFSNTFCGNIRAFVLTLQKYGILYTNRIYTT